MAALFSPFNQRSLTLRNRIVVSPMCQYSCT
jgi:2,4-dienoyl-CoA reductase-like NADH-dependent reductase (Old Yellow Enzyme family)